MPSIFTYCDAYKLSHWLQYPSEVRYVYSNLTPRKSLRPGIDKFVFFGLQAFVQKLTKAFDQEFFSIKRNIAVADYVGFYTDFFGSLPSGEQIQCVESLHNLGYLPIQILALPEGSVVDHGIPVCVIFNTHPDFPWLTNFIESWLSAEIWLPSTSATTAMCYRARFDKYAEDTSDQPFMSEFQGHDFSFRGMCGIEAAAMSGAGHLLSFKGSDTLPAIGWIKDHYGPVSGMIATSVPATEHSVASAGILTSYSDNKLEGEIELVRRLLKQYPTGILSYVADTYDFWAFVTQVLPAVKGEIMARDGKFVVRPDSGVPEDILCGTTRVYSRNAQTRSTGNLLPEEKGLIECLYELFGGTTNSKGYIELDSHIGAIYGDSITLERQETILSQLKAKGFASTNVVLGIGSFTYQYVTRDTHGLAVKATAVGDINQNITPIYKDPKTDLGGKKSAFGLSAVYSEYDEANGPHFDLKQNVSMAEMFDCAFNTVLVNGEIVQTSTFDEIRDRLTTYREGLVL